MGITFNEVAAVTDAQALQEAKRRWGAKGGINSMSIPADDEGDAVPWFEVGIVESVTEDGHVVQEWNPLGEGDSREDAFADAGTKSSEIRY
jgi:hypothetical protein